MSNSMNYFLPLKELRQNLERRERYQIFPCQTKISTMAWFTIREKKASHDHKRVCKSWLNFVNIFGIFYEVSHFSSTIFFNHKDWYREKCQNFRQLPCTLSNLYTHLRKLLWVLNINVFYSKDIAKMFPKTESIPQTTSFPQTATYSRLFFYMYNFGVTDCEASSLSNVQPFIALTSRKRCWFLDAVLGWEEIQKIF